jgi:hypothetical protein
MERGFEPGIKWSLGLFRIVLGCNWATTVTCRMERQENVFTYKGLLLTGIMHKYIHELRIWVPIGVYPIIKDVLLVKVGKIGLVAMSNN